MAVTESGEVRNETGGWRITIGGADGGVFAGRLFGRLTAASPVQVRINKRKKHLRIVMLLTRQTLIPIL